MRSLLEQPVSLRLRADKYQRYQAEARKLGMGLSAYLRMRLDAEDDATEQITQLRLTLLEHGAHGSPGRPQAALTLELLLLMRRLASPADLRAVHQELERLGTPAWSPGQDTPIAIA